MKISLLRERKWKRKRERKRERIEVFIQLIISKRIVTKTKKFTEKKKTSFFHFQL